MYSEKVLDHFKNPRNQGVIENADAVGQEGNPVCLLPQEKIFLNSKFEDIEKIDNGFVVFSHDSSKNKIINKSIRSYKGGIITLKNCLGKISLTPEHLVLAIKLSKHYNFFRTKHKRELIPSWYHAGQLEKRDVVLYPLLKETKKTEFIKIDASKNKHDFNSRQIPSRVAVSSLLLKLFGYFIAEGNIQSQPSKTYISFTLNIKEREIIEDIKMISKKIFGLDVVIKEKPKANTTVVYLYNAQLARFFKELFGNGAENKNLPEFIMSLPLEKQKSLIRGLWAGDGYVNLNRVGPRAGYATISYQLAQQIKNLLLRQKIVCSIYVEPEKKIGTVKHKRAYRIHVGQRDSLIKLGKILKMKYSPQSYQSISSWFDDDYFYTPVTDIKKMNYRGKVCNIEVEQAHSFVSDAFCLHNCGDIMKMYLKIKDNRIDDIKFETLGCAAAIAVSSALTEMVKGKTLDQAAAVTKEDVVDDLGGLPAIKVHCSMLGVDALHQAINNFKSHNT